jgi:hypothetical protein
MLLKPPPHHAPIARVRFDSAREKRLTVGKTGSLIRHGCGLFIMKNTKTGGFEIHLYVSDLFFASFAFQPNDLGLIRPLADFAAKRFFVL